MNSEPGKYVSAKEVDPTRPATTLDVRSFETFTITITLGVHPNDVSMKSPSSSLLSSPLPSPSLYIFKIHLFLAILGVHPIDVVARIESILTEAWPACHMIKHKLLKCEILYIPIAFDDDSFGVFGYFDAAKIDK